MFVSKNGDSSKTERAPRRMFAVIFKKKNVVGERHQEVLMTNYTLRFYNYIFKNFTLSGDCGEET